VAASRLAILCYQPCEGAVIERKMASCIGANRERFERELKRGRYVGKLVVVIEGTLADAVATAKLLDGSSGLCFLQDRDDLFFTVTLSLHGFGSVCPFRGPIQKKTILTFELSSLFRPLIRHERLENRPRS
jgi:hypothetical protein